MDATLHSTICKHVHLLKTSLTTGKICVANSVEVEGVSDNEDGTDEYDIGTVTFYSQHNQINMTVREAPKVRVREREENREQSHKS